MVRRRVEWSGVRVRGRKMWGEDHRHSEKKKRCLSQREVKRQNERASVVSCTVSTLDVAPSLSIYLMIYFWNEWKVKLRPGICKQINMQFLLSVMKKTTNGHSMWQMYYIRIYLEMRHIFPRHMFGWLLDYGCVYLLTVYSFLYSVAIWRNILLFESWKRQKVFVFHAGKQESSECHFNFFNSVCITDPQWWAQVIKVCLLANHGDLNSSAID